MGSYRVQLSAVPSLCTIQKPFNFKEHEIQAIHSKIKRFLDQGIIELADKNSEREYISNIFTRPKPDGRIRIILNLKSFNSYYVDKVRFKIETLQSVTTSMSVYGRGVTLVQFILMTYSACEQNICETVKLLD